MLSPQLIPPRLLMLILLSGAVLICEMDLGTVLDKVLEGNVLFALNFEKV